MGEDEEKRHYGTEVMVAKKIRYGIGRIEKLMAAKEIRYGAGGEGM